jgi:hypothetical protein
LADPQKYQRGYSYTAFQQSLGSNTFPGTRLDNEFEEVEQSIAQAVEAIKDVRRSDGALKNGIVTRESLHPSFSLGFSMRGSWTEGAAYRAGDGVVLSQRFYRAIKTHVATAGSRPDFDPDMWELLFETSIADVGDNTVTDAKIAPAARATQPQAEQGEDAVKIVTPLRLTQKLKYDGFLSFRHFGIRLDGTDETTKINQALANAVPILFKGLIPVYGPLSLTQHGGILGLGENTKFERRFTGGTVMEFDGGEPILLQNFSIGSASGQNIVEGDNGIMLGHATGWAQRGIVKNLIIGGQWVGFWWKGGTDGPIEQVYCLDNKSHGFQGVNPRGRLYGCLSQYNAGHGFYIYAAAGGETGVAMTGCGTFGNQGWGFYADAAGGLNGANLYLLGCGSSFDGAGGLVVPIGFQHLRVDNFMAEYAGHANQFRPAFNVDNSAPGIYLNSANITLSDLRNVVTTHNKGAGARIAGAKVDISDWVVADNGLGNVEKTGLSLSAAASVKGNNLSFRNTTATQAVDIAINTADVGGNLTNVSAATFFDAGGGTLKVDVTDEALSSPVNMTSAATITVPRYAKMVVLTGTVAVTTINVPGAYSGMEISFLLADASVSIAGGGNVQTASPLSGQFRLVKLVRNGNNWFHVR